MKTSAKAAKILTAIFFITAACLFSSCINYKDVDIGGIRNFKVKKASLNEFILTADIEIGNPNNYKIKVAVSNLDVFMKNNYLGKAIISSKLVIPKNSKKIHTIEAKLTMDGGMQTVTALAGMFLGSAKITVKGNIRAKAKMMTKKVPVEFTESIKL